MKKSANLLFCHILLMCTMLFISCPNPSGPGGNPTKHQIELHYKGQTKTITVNEGSVVTGAQGFDELAGINTLWCSAEDGRGDTIITSDTAVLYPVLNVIFIDSEEDLRKIGQAAYSADFPLDGVYLLRKNIQLSTTAWTPIGDNSANNQFTGVFHGGNCRISNIEFTSDKFYIGLFGYTKNSYIGDISLTTAYNDIATTNDTYAGILSGYDKSSTIKNISSSGNFKVTATGKLYLGGVIGYADTGSTPGSITACQVSAVLDGISNQHYSQAYVGGIIGKNTSATIKNCRSTGNIKAYHPHDVNNTHVYAGGIAGYNDTSSIENCFATCPVNAVSENDDSHAGGIAGRNGTGEIKNCSSTAVLTGSGQASAYGGGIVGLNQGGPIKNCSASGNISLEGIGNYGTYVGGISGWTSGTIEACFAQGQLSGVATSENASGAAIRIGGIAGTNAAAIQDSYFRSGSIYGEGIAVYAGGVAGTNQDNSVSTVITSCSSAGSITANGTNLAVAGGITGDNYVSVKASFSLATITALSSGLSGTAYAGGVSGRNYINYGNPIIANCYAAGKVTATAEGNGGKAYAGGVTSVNKFGYDGRGLATLQNCYATGIVSAGATGTSSSAYAGGICAENSISYTQTTVEAVTTGCAALSPKVSVLAADTIVHRITGLNNSTLTANIAISTMELNNNGTDVSYSGEDVPDGIEGTGKNSSQLRQRSTFEDPQNSGGLGWAFAGSDAAWKWVANGYPVLIWE